MRGLCQSSTEGQIDSPRRKHFVAEATFGVHRGRAEHMWILGQTVALHGVHPEFLTGWEWLIVLHRTKELDFAGLLVTGGAGCAVAAVGGMVVGAGLVVAAGTTSAFAAGAAVTAVGAAGGGVVFPVTGGAETAGTACLSVLTAVGLFEGHPAINPQAAKTRTPSRKCCVRRGFDCGFMSRECTIRQ